MFPNPIQKLINHFQKLPGIGPKQGARFAFYLLSMNQESLKNFSRAIADLKKNTAVCSQCFLSFSSESNNIKKCRFCRDSSRDKTRICVVERDQDAASIEQSGAYNGRYHVLKNARYPSGKINKEHPSLKALKKRILALEDTSSAQAGEVIIATSATTSGQEQFLALKNILDKNNIKITRLGRGLSSGIEIEYADPDTLTDAFKNRK